MNVEDRGLMQHNEPRDTCPKCGKPEVDANTPRTVYACGSSDYDGRSGTFQQGEQCVPSVEDRAREWVNTQPHNMQICSEKTGQLISDLLSELAILREREQRYREQVEKLAYGISDVEDLIAQSSGVYGLHLNGDPAPWEELYPPGRYCEWLTNFQEALTVATEVFNAIHVKALKETP